MLRRHDTFTSLWVQLPTNIRKKASTKKNTVTDIKTRPKLFEWTTKHQDSFDAVKEALSNDPVLCYPDFSWGFILETDASLNGLGTVLSQQGKDGEICVIAYASHSLGPSERSMCNYSSAKLELLALEWTVMETFLGLFAHDFKSTWTTIHMPMS